MTQVFLSGVGLVCPAGLNLKAAVSTGVSVSPSTDHERYPKHENLPDVLSVSADFTLKNIVKKRKDLKLMARANQFAVGAADEAIKDAALSDDMLTDAGLFMAVGREPSDLKALLPSVIKSLKANRLDLDTLFAEGLHWINPLSSLKTLPNMSLAHTAIHLGCRGVNMALFGLTAFDQAIDEALRALADKKCSVALVGAADSCTSFYDRLGAARENLGPLVGEGAAVFVLETAEHFKSRAAQTHYAFRTLREKNVPNTCGYSGAATRAIDVAMRCGSQGCSNLNNAFTFAKQKHDSRQDVVITGVGLVSPMGSTFAAFRRNIRDGLSAVAPISHFDANHFSVKNACEVKDNQWWLRVPNRLRSALTTVNERSAKFAVSAALAALQDADYTKVPQAILYGTGLSSVSIEELSQDCLPYLTGAIPPLDFASVHVHDSERDFVSPDRHRMTLPLEHLFEHWGKRVDHYVHFSACAAGAAAIGHGLELIRSGERDVVLVGAADAMIHPYGLIPFAKLGATSTIATPQDSAMPFDKDRSGFVMGETSAFFVLESRRHATQRGRMPYASVKGWGSSCDAHNVTAPHPTGLGAIAAMSKALEDAELRAADIDYINAHGTGTHLNDTAEATAINRVFHSYPPWVSSSKSQFGHCIGAAGAIEFAVCISALTDEFVPPNVSLRNPEPSLDIKLAPRQSIPLAMKYVMSNSFGFGGQNVSLILGHAQED